MRTKINSKVKKKNNVVIKMLPVLRVLVCLIPMRVKGKKWKKYSELVPHGLLWVTSWRSSGADAREKWLKE